jgi:hypothetical protein
MLWTSFSGARPFQKTKQCLASSRPDLLEDDVLILQPVGPGVLVLSFSLFMDQSTVSPARGPWPFLPWLPAEEGGDPRLRQTKVTDSPRFSSQASKVTSSLLPSLSLSGKGVTRIRCSWGSGRREGQSCGGPRRQARVSGGSWCLCPPRAGLLPTPVHGEDPPVRAGQCHGCVSRRAL